MTVLSLMLLHDTKLQLKHISCFVISLFSINSLKFPTFYKEPNYLREFVNFQSQSHPLEFSLPSTPLFCSSSLSTLCTIQPLDLKDVCFLKKLYVYTTDLLTTHLGFPAFSTKVLLPFHWLKTLICGSWLNRSNKEWGAQVSVHGYQLKQGMDYFGGWNSGFWCLPFYLFNLFSNGSVLFLMFDSFLELSFGFSSFENIWWVFVSLSLKLRMAVVVVQSIKPVWHCLCC